VAEVGWDEVIPRDEKAAGNGYFAMAGPAQGERDEARM